MPKARETFGLNAEPEKNARPRAPGPSAAPHRDPGRTTARRQLLSRPPCVTPGQLARVVVLVIGAAFYADRAGLTAGLHLHDDRSRALANVDATPTASIGPATGTEQNSRR